MTGYGEQSTLSQHWEVCVRVKTLNLRHLETRISGLDRYPLLHLKVRDIVNKSFARGRIDLEVELRRARQAPTVQFDTELASQYLKELERMANDLGLPHGPSLEFLLGMEGVTERVMVEEESLWDSVESVLNQAIEQVHTMRADEGSRLVEELRQFIQQLCSMKDEIVKRVPELKALYYERLKERILQLNDELKLNADRLEEEVVMYIERGDISEEIARLQSHFEAVENAIDSGEPIGKRLDFLAQELGREINTIGSKSKDADISRHVIDMKSVLEQFREQVRNIE
jgi:uncharacterized protein (TIGR00255 family)